MFTGSITGPFFLSVMFSSLGLFQQVDCPEGPRCSIPCCIFAHRKVPSNDEGALQAALAPRQTGHHKDLDLENGPRKRRRVTGPDEQLEITANHAVNLTIEPAASKPPLTRVASPKEISKRHDTFHEVPPVSILRPISPPPLRGFKGKPSDSGPTAGTTESRDKIAKSSRASNLEKPSKDVPVESLNPRMLANPPASHMTRLRLITMMHEQMTRLNEEVKKSDDRSKVALELSAQELVRTVLNEEENTAKHSPSIYANVVKNRIGVLKKMKLPAWKEERRKVIEKEIGKPTTAKPQVSKTIDTGISPTEEVAVLPYLLSKQTGLAKHGYVTARPSSVEVEKAREGVEAAQSWEQCDRCRTRFQVFPGRRAEDGALTTGGTCRYHPAKPRRPLARDKTDQTVKDSIHGCCNESVGVSVGCTTADTHVFKISDPKRLALVMPFAETPENPSMGDKKTAVCFDCEMGYTTQGMELVRLTATSWPSGTTLLDTLVRPLGEILDLNSRFSGVWPSDFTSAALFFSPDHPRSSSTTTSSTPPLAFASSPAVARSQLFDLISPTTPLIGHALENDLNATRIIHPSIIDTCLLYPHPRGLPMRHGLKYLMKRFLDRDVQVQDGEQGHDSAEDARSAGDLVRLRVGEVWKGMKRDGWKIKGGQVVEPLDGLGLEREAVEGGGMVPKRGMDSVGETLRRA